MKKRFRIIFIVVLIIIIFLVGLILFFSKDDKIELKQDTFIFEYGDEIEKDVSYYLKDADATKNINDYEFVCNVEKNNDTGLIDIDNYECIIKYNKQEKILNIIVRDTKAPHFTKSEDEITVELNSNVDLLSYFSAEDLSIVKLNIDGEYDLSKVGEYDLKIIAVDSSSNKTEKEFILKVVEPEQKVKNEVITKENNTVNSTNSNKNVEQKKEEVKITEKYRTDISNMYVKQINEYRKSKGLDALPVTDEAQTEANRRAKEIINDFSHDGSGYGFGENIGDGSIGSDFFTAWKNSPVHNATMLREENRAIAVSVYEANNKWYAVAVFRMNY